ncbi:unnamed protein product, partial [Medioppia subpectinata]
MYQKLLALIVLSVFTVGCFGELLDVKTSIGTVRGQTVDIFNTTVKQFYGIPFAEPPVGGLRFAKPLPLKPIKDVIDCTKQKHSCYQNDNFLGPLVPDVSEDCLVLNIWAPNDAKSGNQTATAPLKAVMFWIYGGAYKDGSIFLPTYDGRVLATHDIVLVTVNYRVGPFGFLYGGEETAPGNLGLYDQLLALKWTRENIHLFGGDPNQITIFGESAGSWSVTGHIMSPQSRGLFRRAIMESGAIYMDKDAGILSKTKALAEAKQMVKVFNCSDDSQWLQCLRSIDPKKLNNYTLLDTYPIYDTDFLPINAQHAFKTHNYSADIDIMAGVMRNEGSVLAHTFYPISDAIKTRKDFSDVIKTLPLPGMAEDKITEFYLKDVAVNATNATKRAFWNFFGDVVITCPTYLFAKDFAVNSPDRDVYFFEWTYPSKFVGPVMGCTPEMGVCHAAEIEHVFGLPVLMKSPDADFSNSVVNMWTNFAKTGKPMAGTPYKWPRLIEAGAENPVPKFKEINPATPDHIIDDLLAKTCDG